MAADWLSAIPDSSSGTSPQVPPSSGIAPWSPEAAVPADIPMMRITPEPQPTKEASSSWLDALPDSHGVPTDNTQITGIMRKPALAASNVAKGLVGLVGVPGDIARSVTALGGAQASGELQGNPFPTPPTFPDPGQFQPLQPTTPQMLAAAPGKLPIEAPSGHNPIDTESLLGLTQRAGVTDRPDLQPQGTAEKLLATGSQGVGMVAPTILSGGVSTIPAALRLAGAGAAMGIGGELGTEAGRQIGGTPGAIVGGLIGSATPMGIAAGAGKTAKMVSEMKPLVSQGAQEISVGKTLNKLAGNLPTEESTVGPLSLAQATNNPEIAARADLAPSYNATANANLLKAQQEAVQKQIGQIAQPSTAADASATFTNALRQGQKVAGSEEGRLWTVPKLAQAQVTVEPVQQAVNQTVAGMDPVFRESMSPQLKALVNQLNSAPGTTVRDLNGIRSKLESVARTSLDGSERSTARSLSDAFMTGMDKVPQIAGETQDSFLQRAEDLQKSLNQATARRAEIDADFRTAQPVAGQQIDPTSQIGRILDNLRNQRASAETQVNTLSGRLANLRPIASDPEIASSYQTARDYTRQMRTMFGAPDAAALLNKNAAGVFTKDPSEGARQFFNFSNGSPEGPQSIAQLSDFVGQLKAQPMAAQVSGDMRDAARSYVASALTKAARAEEGQNFNAKTMQDFLRTNGPWIKSSGLFEQPQIDAADHLLNYADMLRRPDQLMRQVNSSTQARLARQDTFVDQIINPTVRHIAEVGATIGGAHSHGLKGGIVGMMMGGGLENLSNKAEGAMRQLMAEALLDPSVAKGLMMKASAANRMMMSPQARRAIDTAKASVAATIASEGAFPQQQPTTAQSAVQ